MFLIRWQNCNELDLLPASEVNEKSPQNVIEFYEKRSPLVQRAKEKVFTNVPIIPDAQPVISKVEAIEDNNESAEIMDTAN